MTDRLSTAAQVARIAELDRRYVAARDALAFAFERPSVARFNRWRWYALRYARLHAVVIACDGRDLRGGGM